MGKLLIILGFIFAFDSLFSQNLQNPNYYYYEGEKQYWTEDLTSANIIVKNMHNYNGIVENLRLLFPNPSDEIVADDEDDNIIINSPSLPSMNKGSIIAAISIASDDIAFFTYSKLIDDGHIWLRNELLVKLKDTMYFSSFVNPVIQNYNNIVVTYEGDNEYSIICQTEYDVVTLANILYDTSFVVYSTPDFYNEGNLFTNDFYYTYQWGLKNIGQSGGTSGVDIKAEEAWAFLESVLGNKGSYIKVAVIDDGVEPHEDLYTDNWESKVLDGYTANGDGTGRPREYAIHGQACAGIIAASHNSIGIAGIAPNARIVPIRIVKKGGAFFNEKKIANAITKSWSDFGAQVLSNSWGISKNQKVTDAINGATTRGRGGKGCIVVAASGNYNWITTVAYPASLSNVIAVGAIDRCGYRAGRINQVPITCDPWTNNQGSCCGNNLNVVAPGSNIPTLDRGKYYDFDEDANTKYYMHFGGTSSACPHVAGVVALMLSVNPNLREFQFRNIIESTTQKVGNYNYQSNSGHPNGTFHYEVGYGLIDAHKAVISAFMYGRTPSSSSISGMRSIGTCNTYSYSCDIYRSDLFTYEWIVSSNLAITHREGNSIKIIPTGAGAASITVKVYAQGREIYSLTRNNIVVTGTSSSSLVALTTSTNPIEIGSTVYWSNNNHLLPVEVIVKDGGRLHITGHVKCMSNVKIIVRPGGRLYINGGTLTGMCNGSWKGIEVWGTRAQTEQEVAYHGVVQLSNGAVIENAEFGLMVGVNTSGAYSAGYGGGGIIFADDATFRNNKKAVYFQTYTRKNWSGTETANRGYFTNCNFIKDNNAFLGGTDMIYMKEIVGVRFNGCVFNNTSSTANNEYGMLLYDASIRMDRSNCVPSSVPNPTSYKPNSFSGFKWGIYIINSITKSSTITYADFSNCETAIYANSCSEINILSCKIDVGSANSTTGIYLNTCNRYKIENNVFEGEGDKVGIHFMYTSEDNNYIRYNTFTDLCSPIFIAGANGNYANGTGVQVLCNHFEDNGTPIRVRTTSTMRPLQGSSGAGAGNRFINPVVSFNNEGAGTITYYWNSNYPEQEPIRYNPSKFSVQTASATGCAKGIGYQGDQYYLYVVVDPPGGGFEPGEPGLASLSISYANQQELLTAKQMVYKQRYANKKIDLNAVKSGNLNDPQVSSYLELADISESVSSICREAFRIIFEDTVFDRNEFHTWLQRENTLKSYYTLAESYVEILDWTNAKKILDKIPVLFPDCDKTQHQYYETCLALQYQWKDKDRSEISQKEIRVLESMLIGTDEEGIASAKARGMWDWIHDTNTTTCPFPEGLCSRTTEEIAIQGKTQKSMGGNQVVQDEINNDLISVNIYPNPARNAVFISLDKMPETSVYYQFYDIQGKELHSGNFSNQKQELDISAISKGIYFISVTVENQLRITKKVVKE